MLTEIDASMLAEAFPPEYLHSAAIAGEFVSSILDPQQSTERFSVLVEGQSVLIPARLRFSSDNLALARADEAWRFARALQTRSNDGYERQRAVRDLLVHATPWGAPFIVALIGEYVIEILDDIANGLSAQHAITLGTFVRQNEMYWNTTKRRVASYWSVYYRSNASSETRRAYSRSDYVGFKLIKKIEAAAFGLP